MVAYSFKARFAEPIAAGTKRQTIRARGKRPHAQPGQLVQLYTGMRTKACRKIAPDVVCESVVPVRFDLRRWSPTCSLRDLLLDVDGVRLVPTSCEVFAEMDGFVSFADMVDFWAENHRKIRTEVFEGVCIRWVVAGAPQREAAE